MGSKFKKYVYFTYPHLPAVKKTLVFGAKTNRKNDLNSIYEGLEEGVEVHYKPYHYLGNMILSQEDFDTLAKGETGDNACARVLNYFKAKSQVITDTQNIPTYLIKIPEPYVNYLMENIKEGLLPLPYTRMPKDCPKEIARQESHPIRFVDKPLNKSTAEWYQEGFYPLINGESVYGVMDHRLGGFYRNPKWTPVPNNRYLVPDAKLYDFQIGHGETDFMKKLVSYRDSNGEMVCTEDSYKNYLNKKGYELYSKHKIENIKEKYRKVYGEDIETPSSKQTDLIRFVNRANQCMDLKSQLELEK